MAFLSIIIFQRWPFFFYLISSIRGYLCTNTHVCLYFLCMTACPLLLIVGENSYNVILLTYKYHVVNFGCNHDIRMG